MIGEGQLLNGRYRLLSLEGEGGMAFVYKAHDEDLDRTVAVKVLRPEYDSGDAFRDEARASAKLPHPNIVTVYDVGQDGDAHYIVMEYVDGRNLKDLILAETPMRVGRALDIISQVCRAVGLAHEKGIIHCDLKPQNVLILPNGQAKVTDFGIARALSAASPGQQGQVWGTPYYASPELTCGKPVSPASDVYAIGVMLYEMLTGRLPFEGSNAAEVARQHALDSAVPIQHLNPRTPRYVQQIVDRALAKDPAGRYRTATQLGKFLDTYRQHGDAVTQPLQSPIVVEASVAREAAVAPLASASTTVLKRQPKPGFDWFLLLLAGMAFLSVMGLLPLWGTVISRAFSPTASVPTSTPEPGEPTSAKPTGVVPVAAGTPTHTPEMLVEVPKFVGEELDKARSLAQERGLRLSVNDEQYSTDVQASYIMTQAVEPGKRVPANAEIGVIVSKGPKIVTMPEVVGFAATIKELDLKEMGLIVTTTNTWSIEPIGLIVAQVPDAGSQIAAGTLVTLTVSSGPSDEVGANLDNRVVIQSCELSETSFHPGDSVHIIVTWHVLDRLPDPYTVFIHITSPSGKILVQLDRPPLGGDRPTNTWQAGEKFLDPYTLTLPRDTPPGSYWVRLGLYRGNRRLPVIDPGQAKADQDAVLVRQIEVRSN